jgi:hypothetical protein
MYNDDLDFGAADVLDPKKKGLHDDDLDGDELLDDDEDPLFMGVSEDDDLFNNVGFGDEDGY